MTEKYFLKAGELHLTSVSYKSVGVEEAMSDAEKILGIDNELPRGVMRAIEGFPGINWIKIDGWEELSDLEIFGAMGVFHKIEGNVSIVSDTSYGKGNEAFEVAKEELLNFVGNHLDIFGECLFNGDVLFVDKNKLLMFVFHHSGVWAKFGSI